MTSLRQIESNRRNAQRSTGPRRDPGRCLGSPRQAGHLQHRSGLSVHRRGLHQPARQQWHRYQHGWQRGLAGQPFVERLWRSVKYEEVYLRAYETIGEPRISIGRYLDFYNGGRPHSSLDDRAPMKPTRSSSAPRGGLTPADAPLIDAEYCSDSRDRLLTQIGATNCATPK